jgi:lipoate-protein ligase A
MATLDTFTNLALEDWIYRNYDFTNHHILMLWANDPSLLLVATHHQNSDFHNVLCKIRRKTKHRIHLSLELLNFIIFLFHATIF